MNNRFKKVCPATLHFLIPATLLFGLTAVASAVTVRFVSFDYPLAGITDTEATAITSSGVIVGRYFTPDGRRHGFMLKDGSFTSVDVPGAISSTDVAWINSRGELVGSYDSDGKTHAFVLNGNTLTDIDYTGAQITPGFGISNAGDVIGTEFDSDFFTAHGYLFRHGRFSLIDFPGALATWPTMASDSRRIVGTYLASNSPITAFSFGKVDCRIPLLYKLMALGRRTPAIPLTGHQGNRSQIPMAPFVCALTVPRTG